MEQVTGLRMRFVRSKMDFQRLPNAALCAST
jgi:hypothetical protein